MPPRKSMPRGPRPRRAARPSATALSVTGGTASSSSSSMRTELSEHAIPPSSFESSLKTSRATIGELQAPIESSSHGDDEIIENESYIEEQKMVDENKSNCNAMEGALDGRGGQEGDKFLSEETDSSVVSVWEAHAEENGQKTDGFIGAEAHIEDSLRDVAMKTSADGNNQSNDLCNGRENTGEAPRMRIVKRIVKVVRVVKRKVPKKVQKSDPDIECSNQETEANLTNHGKIEKEGEQAGSIVAIPMEVDYLRKDEISGIKGKGSLKHSGLDDDKLSKDSGDKLWKMQQLCENVLEKSLILDSLVEKDGECGVDACLGIENVNELNEGSVDMPNKEEPCTKVLEEHDNDAVSFSSVGDKVKDLNYSMDKPNILESCSKIVETPVTFYSLVENNDDSGGDNVKDFNDSIDRHNTLESCTEIAETSVKLNSLADNYNDCGVDHIVSGGDETANEESNKCISWNRKGEGDDEGLVQSRELEALERRRRKTEIFLGGLDKDIEEEDIKKVFAEVGDVVAVRLFRHNTYTTGNNKGYAFVRYGSAANAKKALEKYPTVEIRGKQCRTAPVEGNDTIYLGNIKKTWMTEDVVKLLQEVGIERINKVSLMNDPNNTQRNRGYAFLELETPKDAQIAFKKFQKKDVIGKLKGMKVAWAEPLDEPDEEDMLKVKCIYAEFIPSSWDELKVRDCFTKFGEIETITLARNLRTSKRKDFAFINFKKRDDALSCVQSFKNISGGEEHSSKVNICVSLARPLLKSSVKKKVSIPREKLKVVTRGSGSKPKQTHKNDKYPLKQCVNKNIVVNRNIAVNGNVGIGSSRTAEAVQFLRQQDALRHSQLPQLSSGYDLIPHGVSGMKRPYSALEQNYLTSDPRGFSHPRIVSSPIISSQRYSMFSQGVEMVDPYYHQQQRQRVAPVSAGYNVHPNYLEHPQLQRGEPSYYGIRNWHFRN